MFFGEQLKSVSVWEAQLVSHRPNPPWWNEETIIHGSLAHLIAFFAIVDALLQSFKVLKT